MNRTAQQIKRDMLEWAKHHLDIRASDEWGFEMIDADPLVHLLIGACAAEAKSVYDAIQETDDRLLKRLLRYLLPEAFLYPRPAYGIVKVRPTGSSCQLTPNQVLKIQADEKVFPFSPLFETTLFGGEVRFVGLDSRVIKCEPGDPYFTGTGTEEVSRLLIGIETKQAIDKLENLTLYFDWKGATSERQAFLLALSKGYWTCNGSEIDHQTGLVSGTELLSEQFSPEKQLVRQVASQYRHNFHLISASELKSFEGSVQEVLTNWLGSRQDGKEVGKDVPSQAKGFYTWLRIDLPHVLQLENVERNLIVELNHFPVVNRRLVRKADQGTYFSKSLGFEAVSIQPQEGHFCGIHSVFNLESGEEILPKELSTLFNQEENHLGYALRFGETGRYDNLNAWERLSYLLSLFRQEHKEREVIEELGLKLTLEELHEVLGKRIMKGLSRKAENGQIPTVYVFFRLGPSQKLDAEVRYWVTNGDEANQLSAGMSLFAEPPIPGIDPSSPKLITTTIGGKTKLTETEQTRTLQDILFRRERIVTTHDIKSLCRKLMGPNLQEVTIQPIFETDMDSNGGIRRAIEVSLKVDQADDVHIHQIGQEIESILQENSMGTLPYRVVIC